MSNRQKKIGAILIVIFVAAAMYYFIDRYADKDEKQTTTESISDHKDIDNNGVENAGEFVKEGELSFISAKDSSTLAKIKIELADEPAKITKGLMNRRHIPSDAGMLFIFPDYTHRSFWMKNTIIPLDIIFVDRNMRIINIEENTRPQSEMSVASVAPAKYVVEVNAGFASKNYLKAGDYIHFSLDKDSQ